MGKKTHQTCPYCSHKECFTTWDDGSYFCLSCGAKPKGKVKKEIKVMKEEIKPYRGLSKEAVDKYKIKTQLTDKGEDYARVYQYPHMDKKRILPKDFSDNKGFTNNYLFGMDKFNAGSHKYITVVEGEDDVPAAYDMLDCRYPVVGIPGAGISNSLLKQCHSYLDSFENIIVATDNDDAGERAASRLASAFPNKVYRVSLTKYNDPMEYLEAKDKREFLSAWYNRVKYVPEFDVSTPDQYLKILREGKDDDFISSGIEAYDEEHLGLFQGHVTLIQAPEGIGKTELFHFFEYHILKNYPDLPFASCHLEETKKRTTLAWASYHLNKNVTRKDLITDMTEVEEAISELTKTENAHLFSIGTDEDPLVLIDRIKYYATVCGCKYIFIEPIQDLAHQGHDEPNDERFLAKVAVNLARLATDLEIGIVVIAHENDNGDVSDCRKLAKEASVRIRLERDIDNTDPETRNVTTLWSKKNRPSAFVGYAGKMKFDPESFTMKEYYE